MKDIKPCFKVEIKKRRNMLIVHRFLFKSVESWQSDPNVELLLR